MLAPAGCLHECEFRRLHSLPFFKSDRKLLLVAGFATISTSSLDSSANMSLWSVRAVTNSFLLAPEVCLCEFARVDGLPSSKASKWPKWFYLEVEHWRRHSWRSVVKSYKPRSWFILWQTTVFDQSARGFYHDYVIKPINLRMMLSKLFHDITVCDLVTCTWWPLR